MLALTILSIFVLIIISIVVYEVKNEKRYQDKRRISQDKSQHKTTQQFPKDPIVPSVKKITKPEYTPPLAKQESQNTLKTEPIKKDLPLPSCHYPKFTHVRLINMGLSEAEAKEFVQELIPQLETQIPLVEQVLTIPDFHQMERLTHSLKGSATNLGTGGISDLLVECNTYLKEGSNIDIATTYFKYLKYYTKELKTQYV